MLKIDTELDEKLKKLVGENDFETVKNLPREGKETILKSSGAISTANIMNQCFWIGDRKHNTLYINKAYRDITGYTLEEFIKNRCKCDFPFTEESKQTISKHHVLRTQGISSQYEADILSKDGKLIPVLVHGAPTEEGGTVGIFSNLLAMEKLNRQDRQLLEILGYKEFKIIKKTIKPEDQEMIIKISPAIHLANAWNQAFWLGDSKHRTIYANPIYQKTTGYSLEECIGQQSDFCFDEESKRRIAENHKLRKRGISSHYEGTYLTKKGNKVPVLIIGAPTETGGTHGIHINLTESKKMAANKQIAEQIIRYSSEAIVILDKDRKIELWNSGAEKIFGYREEEVLDKTISLLIPKELEEENDKLREEVEQKTFLKNFETKRLSKNGELIDVSLSVTRVTDEDNNIIGYLLIYADITQKKKTNTELQKRFEAIQDAYKELGLQKRQADYIYEIIDMAVSKSNMESLGRLIVSASCMITKADGAVLRLFDKEKNLLKMLSCLGVSSKWLDKNKLQFANSLAEMAFANKRPIIIHDIDSSPKHRSQSLLKAHKFKTLILIPLFTEENLIGSLSLYATDPAKFRLIETDFLERFGKQCSLAIYVKKV